MAACLKILSNRKTKNNFAIPGMIGIGEPASLTETTGALHAFNIPFVSVAPDPADQSLGAKYSNVLTTAPDMAGQARVRHVMFILCYKIIF